MKKESVVDNEEKVKESKKDLELEKIRRVHEDEKRVFEALKTDSYQSLVSTAYSEMDAFVQMCIKGISTGCLIRVS